VLNKLWPQLTENKACGYGFPREDAGRSWLACAMDSKTPRQSSRRLVAVESIARRSQPKASPPCCSGSPPDCAHSRALEEIRGRHLQAMAWGIVTMSSPVRRRSGSSFELAAVNGRVKPFDAANTTRSGACGSAASGDIDVQHHGMHAQPCGVSPIFSCCDHRRHRGASAPFFSTEPCAHRPARADKVAPLRQRLTNRGPARPAVRRCWWSGAV